MDAGKLAGTGLEGQDLESLLDPRRQMERRQADAREKLQRAEEAARKTKGTARERVQRAELKLQTLTRLEQFVGLEEKMEEIYAKRAAAVLAALAAGNGVSEVARLLDLSRQSVYKMLDRIPAVDQVDGIASADA